MRSHTIQVTIVTQKSTTFLYTFYIYYLLSFSVEPSNRKYCHFCHHLPLPQQKLWHLFGDNKSCTLSLDYHKMTYTVTTLAKVLHHRIHILFCSFPLLHRKEYRFYKSCLPFLFELPYPDSSYQHALKDHPETLWLIYPFL